MQATPCVPAKAAVHLHALWLISDLFLYNYSMTSMKRRMAPATQLWERGGCCTLGNRGCMKSLLQWMMRTTYCKPLTSSCFRAASSAF